jgi:hypothetical protein
MKKLIISLITAVLLSFGVAAVYGQAEEKKAKKNKKADMTASDDVAPKTVIHVVTVAWKPDATAAQIQKALDGVKTLAKEYPGIKRVWTRSFKVQNPKGAEVKRTHAFVMEFASEQALKDYTDSPAQLKWYDTYTPIRLESTTHDITN